MDPREDEFQGLTVSSSYFESLCLGIDWAGLEVVFSCSCEKKTTYLMFRTSLWMDRMEVW